MSSSALASTRVLLHAAGSLRGALTDVAKAFETASGVTVQATYGPSGTLRDEIAGGAKADVFASANMAHPQSLAESGRSGAVALFARNRLCALVRPGLAVTLGGARRGAADATRERIARRDDGLQDRVGVRRLPGA